MNAAAFDRSLALVLGVDAYSHGIPPLRTAVADARSVARRLEEKHGYAVTLLIDGEVTGDAVRTALRASVTAGDRLLLYFAGHGVALDGDTGPEGFLLLHDARGAARDTFFRMTELHALLGALACRHLLVVLDCCFAGAFRWSSTRHFAVVPEVMYAERYERFIRDAAWQVLASAACDQKALDVVDGRPLGVRGEEDRHSPFAAALLAALDGAADRPSASPAARGRGDGVVTATELYLYLRDCVETVAPGQHRQTPSLWPLQKHDKGEYVFLTPGVELLLEPAPKLTRQNNPFRGLESFEPEHARFFFGRRRVTAALVAQVEAQPLTLVLGSSGSGKSSLVKAGLIPAFAGEAGATWEVIKLRSGKAPLLTLKNLPLPSLEAALPTRVEEWLAANPGRRLLLFIDQLEELITLAANRRDADGFLSELAATLTAHRERLRVVATLRSDFAPQLASGPLLPWWNAARFLVPPLSQNELREVIEGPASASVLYYEPPALVDALINEVAQTPGALPLLSFTLSELYLKYLERRASDRALTQTDYDKLGGVAGSLRHRATAEYQALDEAQRATMRSVLLRMVSLEGGELARRRVPRAELVFADAAENARVAAVLTQLAQARLLVFDSEPDGTEVVEPAHDALVRGWDLLLAWSREAQEEIQLRHLLTPAAQDWNRRGHRGGLWNSNPRLFLLRRPLRAGGDWLNDIEQRFAQASFRRRRVTRLTVGAITLAVLASLASLSLAALRQRDAARSRAAESRYAQADTEFTTREDAGVALLMVCEALRELEPAHPRREAMRARALYLAALSPSRVQQVPVSIFHGTVSENLRTLLVHDPSDDPPMSLWDLASMRRMPVPSKVGVEQTQLAACALSPDGRFAAAIVFEKAADGTNQPRLRMWECGTAAPLLEVEDVERARLLQNQFGFSGDSQFFFLRQPRWDGPRKFHGGTVLWDLAKRAPVTVTGRILDASPPPIAFRRATIPLSMWNLFIGSPGVMSVSRDAARNWLLAVEPPATLLGHPGPFFARFFDFQRGLSPVGSLGVQSSEPFFSVQLSGDASTLAAVTGSEALRRYELKVWDTTTGQPRSFGKPVVGETGFLIHDISRNGRTVLLASAPQNPNADNGESRIQAVRLDAGAVVELPLTTETMANALHLAADGQSVAALSKDLLVRVAAIDDTVLNYRPFKLPVTRLMTSAPHLGVLFSPTNDCVHVLTRDGSLRSWDLRGEARLAERMQLAGAGEVELVAFSRDAARVLTVAGNRDASQLNLWETASGRPIWSGSLQVPMAVRAVAFSADGRHVAVSANYGTSYRGEVRVWTTDASAQSSGPPIAVDGLSDAVALSHDGSRVSASWHTEGGLKPSERSVQKVQQWHVATAEAVREARQHSFIHKYFAGDGVSYPVGRGAGRDQVLHRLDSDWASAALHFETDGGLPAELVESLVRDARSLRSESRDTVVVELGGTRIALRTTAAGMTAWNEASGTGLRLPNTPFNAHYGRPTFSLDGRWIATAATMAASPGPRPAAGTNMVISETATGLPVCNALWHEGTVRGMTFSPSSDTLISVTHTGALRKWRFRQPPAGSDAWMVAMGEALSGMRLGDDGNAHRLSHAEHQKSREKLRTLAREAATAGDFAARTVLALWKDDVAFTPPVTPPSRAK